MSEQRRDLLDKLKAIEAKRAQFEAGTASPGSTVIEQVLGPCEIVIGGRPTLMFGSNNYLGLTFDPSVMAAAREAILQYGTGTNYLPTNEQPWNYNVSVIGVSYIYRWQ